MPEAALAGATVALTPFHMPSLGADMEEGTIIEWLVSPGTAVRRGDVVAIVQTEKSDLDVEVFHDGVIAELAVPVGQKVPVGAVIAMLAPPGAMVAPAAVAAAAPVAPVAPPAPVPPAAAFAPPAASERMPSAAGPAPVTFAHPAEPVEAGHVASPVLRHLAEHLHVDTTHLRGSGPGGRVTRDDIEHAAARPRISPRARRLAREQGLDLSALPTGAVVTGATVLQQLAAAPPAVPAPVPERAVRRGPDPAAMRQAIARQMTTAWQEIPHYRVSTRVDVDDAMRALDERNLSHPAAERILPAALLLRAVARAAAKVPAVNGHWVDGAFVPGDGVHLGVVVSLRTGGLLAPVIRDADRKDLTTIMGELRDLVTRARSGRLRASEVGTATLTVTDLGEGAVDEVSPIIHPPQVAIVGFGSAHQEPCVVDGEIVVRTVVHASLAGDHRAIDGRIGSQFLTTLVHSLQEPLEP